MDGSPDLCDAPVCCCVDRGFGHDRPSPFESEFVLDYTEVLRRLAINDEHFAEECVAGTGAESAELDPRTLALVRLAALAGGRWRGTILRSRNGLSLERRSVDGRNRCGAVGIVSVVGLPSVVAAAPCLAMALECDLEDAR
jgi:4-carboxymuconolactone decarboxylase